MKKYSEQEILEAYREFNSERDWVSLNAHDIIAYDYLKSNQPLLLFLKRRPIFPLYLYYCLNSIVKKEIFDSRNQAIAAYCKERQIIFDKYDDIELLYNLGMRHLLLPLTITEINETLIGTDTNHYQELIVSLANQLRLSMKHQARFGIMEYCAYYSTDIRRLKKYLDCQQYFDDDSQLVYEFIADLESKKELESINYDTPKVEPKHVVNKLTYDEDALRETISNLMIARYPILSGTLSYAYVLHEKGRLENFSKVKVKAKFERLTSQK